MSHRVLEPLEGRLLLSTLPAGFTETNIAKVPTTTSATMAFTPDGRLFVGDTKAGQIRVIKNNALLPTAAITMSVDRASERGINGIAIAPNFASAPAGQKYVFVYYTRPDPAKPNVAPSNAKNRLSRFTVSSTNADQLVASSETVLIDNINATAGNHNGGTLQFGADGMLYVGVGEATMAEEAQSLGSYGGKILRINAMDPSNLIPADNPFVGTSGALGAIWAYGFRNPFTGGVKPGTSTLYINDVGASSWEEIDNVQKGKNYGWPRVEGPASNPLYVDPIYSYAHNGSSKAITGGAFYNGTQFPAAYKDKYFFGDYILKTIWSLNPATNQATTFASNTLAVVDMDVNPIDGSLWYLGLDGSVQRIGFASSNQAPVTAIQSPVNLSLYNGGQTITFNGSATDPEDGVLAASKLSWSITFLHAAQSQVIRTATGVSSGTFTIPKVGENDPNQWYRITLTATDSGGLQSSTSVEIVPRKSTFTLATNIAGLKLNLDGVAKSLPVATQGVVGMTRTLGAPATQTINGKTYEFVSWSDGKPATHTIDTPTANTTFTATYRQVTATVHRAAADAYVRDGSSTGQNFGSATELLVKKSTTGFNRHAYLRFDIGTAAVSSAFLRVYGKIDSTTIKNIPIDVFTVDDTGWGEGTINFTNKPATSATALKRFTLLDSTARYYDIDVTDYVKQQRASAKTAVSFALKGGTSTSAVAIFNSDEATANRPELVITA